MRRVNAARAEFTNLVAAQRQRYPETHAKREVALMTFNQGLADPGAGLFLTLWQAASLLLLFIACANIANLLLARGAERAQEFSLRRALGGSRWRIAGQLLIEGAMLATLGVLASIPLAWAGLELSRNSIPANVLRFVPGLQFMKVDERVLALTALLGVIATIAFSLLPALHASRASVADTLRESGRTQTASSRRQWIRGSLAVAQVALTLALLFGSGLMLAGADRAVNGALGFNKNNLMTAQLVLPDRPYAEAEVRRQFIDRVLTTMRAIPAASEVAFTSAIPYGQSNPSRSIFPEGQTDRPAGSAQRRFPSRLTDFAVDAENPAARWPRFYRCGPARHGAGRDHQPELCATVLGRSGSDRPPLPNQLPTANGSPSSACPPISCTTGSIRSDARPTTCRIRRTRRTRRRSRCGPSVIRSRSRAICAARSPPPIRISRFRSCNRWKRSIDERAAGLAFLAKALAVVALIAFVLAVAGVYSLMAYNASQRTKEIGVHLALGASWWQVVRLTLGQALRITVVGMVIGSVMAVGRRSGDAVVAGRCRQQRPDRRLAVLIVVLDRGGADRRLPAGAPGGEPRSDDGAHGRTSGRYVVGVVGGICGGIK